MKKISLGGAFAPALAMGLALLLPASAWSADPVLGTGKFSQNCASCHSVASTATVDRGRNSRAMISSAIANVQAMGFLSSLSTADLDDIAAYLGNSPASLAFGATALGQTSSPLVVTVRASRSAALSGLSASASGDYLLQGGTCGSTLAASASCTVGVAFAPGAAGTRSGTLSINHSGVSTPVLVALAGTGTAAAQATLALDATSLAFGNQTVGATSAARTVTLTNTGNAALAFTSIAVAGSAAGDFATGGSCAVGTPVAAGASCSVSVSFTPAAAGSRSASLGIGSNAANGSASVALGGTGLAAATAAVSLSPATLAFGNVTVGSSAPAQTVTLSNTGTAPLNLQGVQVSGPFTSTHACGSSLAASASCTLAVVFTPTAAGSASGGLQVSSDAAGSPHSVALSGNGVLAGAGALQWSGDTALDFGSVAVGADSPLQRRSLTNAGNAAATLGSLALQGDHAADFRVDTASTCAAGLSLAAGASCEVVLGFVPSAAGSRVATLALSSDNAATPATLSLGGTGSIAAAPGLALSAGTLSFVAPSGGAAPTQSLSLSNSGAAELHVSALTLGSSRFTLSSPATQGCGAAPFALAAGASCELQVAWLGSAGDAAESSELSITSDATPAIATVTLQAAGAAAAPSNAGGGGCTLGAGSAAADPTLLLLAAVAALLAWRRRRPA